MIGPAVRRCLDSSLLGLDTETLGLVSKKYTNMTDLPIVLGLSPDEDTRYFVPMKYAHSFQEVVESEVPKALWNSKFDAHRLANIGIEIGGPWVDGMVGDFLYDEDTRENRHGLKPCAQDYFNIPMKDYKTLFGKVDPRGIEPGHELWEKYLDYGSLDPWAHRKCCKHLMDELARIYLWDEDDFSMRDHYWDVEEAQLKCLFDMERRGIRIDVEYLDNVGTELQKEMDDVAAELASMLGVPLNPNSTKQVAKLLFEDMDLAPLGYTPGGAPQCDAKTLDHFALIEGIDECKLIVQYRKASKMKGTYAEGLVKQKHTDGKIHTTYNPIKVTGRLSSSEPNLQNIPRPDWDTHGIRAAFIADDPDNDFMIGVDYSQLEMRILAHYSGDQRMIEGILRGLDMHSYTAAMMLGEPYDDFIERKNAKDESALLMRQSAKNVGFGIVYGITKIGLAAQLTEKLKRAVDKSEAQEYIDLYLDAYPGVRTYMSEQIHMARHRGYVQTISGRFRRLSKASGGNWKEKGHAERQAVNAPIQGSAADIVKKAMVMCWSDAYLEEELGCTLRMQVHDELIFNCPKETAAEAMEIIQEYLEHPFSEPLVTPLPADPSTGANWKECK